MRSRVGSSSTTTTTTTIVAAILLLLVTALRAVGVERSLYSCSEPLALVRADSPVSRRVRQVVNRSTKTESDPDVAPDAFDHLKRTQDAFRAVAQRLRPSLVRIETVGGSQPPAILLADPDKPDDDPRRTNVFRDAPGSSFVLADGPTTGIVYSADGYIVTSSFNFVREPLLISVTIGNDRRLAAELVARDRVRKIALLKVDADDLPVPQWRSSESVQVGEWAVALGLGFGGQRPAVTAGIISALNRMSGNAMQTDAKLSPANYGGPLCDIFGRVIGISVPMAQRPGELAGIDLYDAGVGFVVPMERVDEIVEVLKTGQSFYRGWLGVQIRINAPDGAVVKNVADPSPVRSAGLQPKDRIVWAQGRDVHHFGDLIKALYMIPAGEDIYLHVEREVHHPTSTIQAGGQMYILHTTQTHHFCVTVQLARNTELGPLPEDEEEPFDPSKPFPMPSQKESP